MNRQQHALIVPYDLSVSGTIVFISRLKAHFELMGLDVTALVMGSAGRYVDDSFIQFADAESIFKWLNEHACYLRTVFWCGFFLSASDRKSQIELSCDLAKNAHILVSYLWERTGYENAVPENTLFRKVCASATALIALNGFQVNELVQRGATAEIIHLLSTGVDTMTEYAPISSKQREKLRHHLGWPKDVVVFLTLSRLTARKRVDTVVRAWKDLEISHQEARYVVVGSGFKSPSSVESEILRYASILDNMDYVKYNDTLDRKQFYQAADVFISAGVIEGEPTTLIEAMACGLPVIASKGHGHERLVRNNDTGLLFEKDDWVSFGNAVYTLCRRVDRRNILGKNARQLVVRERDIRVVSVAFIETLIGDCMSTIKSVP